MTSFAEFFNLVLRDTRLFLYSESSSSPRVADFQYLFQTNRVIAFFFVEQLNNACRSFTAQLRELYSNCNSISPTSEKQKYPFGSPAKIRKFFNGQSKRKQHRNSQSVQTNSYEPFEVVVISLDRDEQAYRRTLSETFGWWSLPFAFSNLKNRLLRFFGVQYGPALVLIDTAGKEIITTDGKRGMQDDSEGKKFPWWPPFPEEVFSGSVLSNRNQAGTCKVIDIGSLAGRKKGLLFSANWCPPCRTFVRQLVQTYENIRKSVDESFEIIFCSSDRSEESFRQHFSQMPWLAFPYGDERIRLVTRLYNVQGIPSFFILDEENQLITKHGKISVLADPAGSDYPWLPKSLIELNEFTASLLREDISVILFTEGNEGDKNFAEGVMGRLAEKEFNRVNIISEAELELNGNGNEKLGSQCPEGSLEETNKNNEPVSYESCYMDPLQFFFTGDDPICDQILDSLGLHDAPLPLICILDVFGEALYICEEPDVSEDVLNNFVSEFRAGSLTSKRISQTDVGKVCGVAHVGGIPLNAISAALGMSPSQNTMGQSLIVGTGKC